MPHWTDYLPEDVDNRLGNCRSRKSDVKPLTDARWRWMKENGKDKGLEKADALVYILELLDCNSCYIELTQDEWDSIVKE